MKPIIGITGNMLIMDSGVFPGLERADVINDYVEAIVKAGGVPLVLPIVLDEELVRRQLEIVDGLIVSGGFDVNPLVYGEEPSKELGFIYPERDRFDLSAIKMAVEFKKPILGICRGIHILNVAFGGTLYQDVSYIEGSYIKHRQNTKSNAVVGHTIQIAKGTILNSILKENTVVNSFHHQAIKKLAEEFIISAKSKDGVIEAIEKEGDQFILGVQWHPEMMVSGNCLEMLKIFKRLVEVAAK